MQLKAPPELRAAGPQHRQRAGQRPERQQHADREDHAVHHDGPAPMAGLVHEAQYLDSEHGKDAGHEVEDEPAEKCQGERRGQIGGRGRRRWTACAAGHKSHGDIGRYT